MQDRERWVVVGLDTGGTMNNATVLDGTGRFLVEDMVESPSLVREGPDKAIEALAQALDNILELTGIERGAVRAVGLDTPGPVSANGVISSRGATNFSEPEWRGFDVRGALEGRIGLPVLYNNDANAAALYAHHAHFGPEAAALRSSVSAIVGTGLGGGVIEAGRVVRGAAGMAGEFGHVWIPMDGLLGPGQPAPVCNCGFAGDAESVASLTGIGKNLLPYWLTRFPGHELAAAGPLAKAAKLVRGLRGGGRPPGPGDLRAAGQGRGQAVHDRRELHRPGCLLPGRWRGAGRAALPRLVPRPGPGAHHAARRAGFRGLRRARSGPGHGRRPRLGDRRARRGAVAAAPGLAAAGFCIPDGELVQPGLPRCAEPERDLLHCRRDQEQVGVQAPG